MGTPRKVGPNFIRHVLAQWFASGSGAATVAPDFAANTAVTVFGGTGGFTPGFWCELEKLRFIVGNTDFAGASGTLTFVVRKGSTAGAALITLVIPLASAVRGAVIEASVSAANDGAAQLSPTDKLFITRTATGTVFTTGEGTFQLWARQVPQSRGQ